MVGQFIDTFWRKSFIGELRLARKVAEDETLWTLTHAGKAHQFQFVWLQGLCVKIDKNADSMVIEDATGQAEIQGCSRVPDAWSTSEGDYIMIAGKFLGTNGSTQVLVDAYRIQSLTSTRTHEGRWPFEVVDISQRVYHFISS